MCLVALSIGLSERFPLVLATNRDEFFDRPAAPLAWWSPAEGPDILSGRDLEAGGTWIGMTRAGRLALLTNIRKPPTAGPGAPSRGEIVPLWLRGGMTDGAFFERIAQAGYNPFNLIAADLHVGKWYFASSESKSPRQLAPGLYGLSNASLDTPWPKTLKLKQALAAAVASTSSADALTQSLFEALADSNIAPDTELPNTGIALQRERELSPAFIRTPDGRYGTRCSTLLIGEHTSSGMRLRMTERSFAHGGSFSDVSFGF